jgi:hypothetical protein
VFVCDVTELAPFRANGETSGIAQWREGATWEIDGAALAILRCCASELDRDGLAT